MPWDDSWNEHRPYPCAMCAFRALVCGLCAGKTPGTPEQPTFNPLVQGSSPWRPTFDQGFHQLVQVISRSGCSWVHVSPHNARPIRSAASVMTSGRTWAYLEVMLICEWPRISITTRWSTPWASKRVAAVCRASWTRRDCGAS